MRSCLPYPTLRSVTGTTVIDEHYLVACDSLVWVLERGLGHILTSDEWEAWTTTLDTLTNVIDHPVGVGQSGSAA
ncbi:hypothetical protein [Bradyrhizobium sp. CCGUVB23]|uniref:hypothetical protein n=1 Tax=Bradyrhizobium sp. CCGUVB23 TaxID=2949630 RepID=UPI0020B3D966|nr:hypothetical protein [Bradyrhizobium sp. CCGUVB23]MCP3465937.1 hypothetical protein [Bradyrhizobium sp. CCGUVB23]